MPLWVALYYGYYFNARHCFVTNSCWFSFNTQKPFKFAFLITVTKPLVLPLCLGSSMERKSVKGFVQKSWTTRQIALLTTRWCNLTQNAHIVNTQEHCWDLQFTINKERLIQYFSLKKMPISEINRYRDRLHVDSKCWCPILVPAWFQLCQLLKELYFCFIFDLSSCQQTGDQTRHVQAIYLGFRHSWRLLLFKQRELAHGMHRQCVGGQNTTCRVTTTKLSHLY